MEQVGDMKLYSLDEVLDSHLGEIGTPLRDSFESEVKEAVDSYHIGKAIKETRLQQNLTQKQLGERMGVQEAQISKIESGKSVTFSTNVRAFKALGVETASLDLGEMGKFVLW